MLLRTVFASALLYKVICEGIEKKITQVSFAVPLEFPNRNDRADQCWLRIEDVDLTNTVTVHCHIAQAFLGYYIHDYNIKKMTEDGVDVSLWIEKPRGEKDAAYGPPEIVNGIKNWRVTTLLDPTTKRRIYVTKNAICRMIMYSREGMANYIVDCETVLYFVNEHLNGAVFSRANSIILAVCVFLVFII